MFNDVSTETLLIIAVAVVLVAGVAGMLMESAAKLIRARKGLPPEKGD